MIRSLLIVILAALSLLAAWQIAVTATGVPGYLVPAPLAVAQSVVAHWRVLLGQTGFTVVSAALGLAVSTLFATVFAVLFILSRNRPPCRACSYSAPPPLPPSPR